MSWQSVLVKKPDDDGPDLWKHSSLLKTQLLIAGSLGMTAFLSFCVLRKNWPQIYAARTLRRKGLPSLPNSYFGWIPALYKITEEEVLEHCGLDCYVFLQFFKMAIIIFALCTFFAVTVIGPIRRNYDNGDEDGEAGFDVGVFLLRLLLTSFGVNTYRTSSGATEIDDDPLGEKDPKVPPPQEDYQPYLWTYVFFTYVFTGIVSFFLMQYTQKVIRVRQRYLGAQNSITDRTIRLSGIPTELRDENRLTEHIEKLDIGDVRSITICREWGELDQLFVVRKEIIKKLEGAWCVYLGPREVDRETVIGVVPTILPSNNGHILDDPTNNNNNDPSSSSSPASTGQNTPQSAITPRATLQLGSRTHSYDRPTVRIGGWHGFTFWGLYGTKVDAIDYYTAQLDTLDQQIIKARHKDYTPTNTAFVTMDSVASAQMVAQAVLDPSPYHLIAKLAPAPHDIIWKNIYMSTMKREVRTYAVTIAIGFLTVALVPPVLGVAKLMDTKTISKSWPALGQLLKDTPWLEKLVTGILPPYLFTILNFALPYFYVYLASLQGFISHGDEELSVISKNFFYIFVNLFLIFTVAGAAIDIFQYLKDTTSIAYKLASSLKKWALFYVDLIVLQGIGMFPFRLLEFGNLIRFGFEKPITHTPREFRSLYTPPVFNFGLNLPQPILILIITLLYSVFDVMSSKILAAGTAYFVLGYFTYKYLLMYAMVHPSHSTGQAWPMIVRRVCVGLVLFHATMSGILALQQAYYLATLLAPLPVFAMLLLYNFENNYQPLTQFIALQAIRDTGGSGVSFTDLEGQRSMRHMRSQTLDEARERFLTYNNPHLTARLDGPWIGNEGDQVVIANQEGTIRRKVRLDEFDS